MSLSSDLAKAFHPASIAIVGVSGKTSDAPLSNNGLATLCNLLDLGFKGRIYPINPNASEILGLKAYPSVTAVPEPVDLVIVAVPARLVPSVLRDCVEAKALNVHVMTSGFGESQQEEGRKLQEEVRQIALTGGLRLIGPNCMGLHVPSAKISTYDFRPHLSGPVAFVSQSGSVMDGVMRLAAASGIGFSKMISCGNSLILDTTDFVEYLATDAETGIIGMYIEGVTDGKRLLQVVRKTNPSKPVIIWKVGLSDSSARAALSHSGMMGGERHTWESFFKQTGSVRVRSLEELSDMIMTFMYMKPPAGKAAAVLTVGGGSTVAAGDICAESGISVPALSPESREELLKTVSLVNQGVANPLDIPDSLFRADLLGEILVVLTGDQGIDFLIINWPSIGLSTPELAGRFAGCVCQFIKENRNNKPLAISIDSLTGRLPEEEIRPWIQQILQAGVPVYDSLARACCALSGFIDYHSQSFSSD